jgi:hypothetical protein
VDVLHGVLDGFVSKQSLDHKDVAVGDVSGQEWQISAKDDASKPLYCQECYWKRRQLRILN